MSEASGRAARSSHVERDRFRVSFFNDATQSCCDISARRIQDFEEMLQVFFRITNQREAIEFVSTTIGKDKEIAPALT